MNKESSENRVLIVALPFLVFMIMVAVVAQAFQINQWKQFAADQDEYLYYQLEILKQYIDNKQPEYIIIPETIYVPTPGPSGGLDG